MKLLIRLKDFRFQRYESGTQELIGPSCEMTASKCRYFSIANTDSTRLFRIINLYNQCLDSPG
ncbi:hypothetical protein EYF80_032502 [Liparis tanakae]|uniref:Uncharacterized protein n=1 Tax=Liparis tanakae TaxID=230148 RepID=A0A4Z2GX28_9TELE|nr:hypothetical protein EYF80_032502 [Liparis tanakae]